MLMMINNLPKNTSVVVHSSKASITATKPDKGVAIAIQHQFVYASNIRYTGQTLVILCIIYKIYNLNLYMW